MLFRGKIQISLLLLVVESINYHSLVLSHLVVFLCLEIQHLVPWLFPRQLSQPWWGQRFPSRRSPALPPDRDAAALLAQTHLGARPSAPANSREGAWTLWVLQSQCLSSLNSYSQVPYLPVPQQMNFCAEVHNLQRFPFHKK